MREGKKVYPYIPNSLVVGIPGRIIEDKGQPELIEQGAISYYLLSRKYITGEDRISPDELMQLLQAFKPEK